MTLRYQKIIYIYHIVGQKLPMLKQGVNTEFILTSALSQLSFSCSDIKQPSSQGFSL